MKKYLKYFVLALVIGLIIWYKYDFYPFRKGNDLKTKEAIATATDTSNDFNSNISVITVYIHGAVNQPKYYKVPSTTRLYELIKVAGGTTIDADLEGVNLATIVVDSGSYFIPSKTEDRKTKTDGKISINKASLEELQALDGIGPSKAKAIIDYRNIHPFISIEELANVDGIGEKLFNQIRDYICL